MDCVSILTLRAKHQSVFLVPLRNHSNVQFVERIRPQYTRQTMHSVPVNLLALTVGQYEVECVVPCARGQTCESGGYDVPAPTRELGEPSPEILAKLVSRISGEQLISAISGQRDRDVLPGQLGNQKRRNG